MADPRWLALLVPAVAAGLAVTAGAPVGSQVKTTLKGPVMYKTKLGRGSYPAGLIWMLQKIEDISYRNDAYDSLLLVARDGRIARLWVANDDPSDREYDFSKRYSAMTLGGNAEEYEDLGADAETLFDTESPFELHQMVKNWAGA